MKNFKLIGLLVTLFSVLQLIILSGGCKKPKPPIKDSTWLKFDTLKFPLDTVGIKDTLMQPKLVVIIVDGPRYSETFGDTTRQYANALWQLAQKGILYTNYYNNGITNTINGIVATITGKYDSLVNNNTAILNYETYLQAWQLTKNGAPNNAWIISSKDKIAALEGCTTCGNYKTYLAKTNCGVLGLNSGYRDDAITLQEAKTVINTHQPEVLLLHWRDPDFSGHTGNWNNYLTGLNAASNNTLNFYNFLQAHPNYKNQTYFFITNDHGRHLDGIADGFTSHGDDCEGCRHISLTAIGPRIPATKIDTTRYDQLDLCTTLSEQFGLGMTQVKGKVIKSLRGL